MTMRPPGDFTFYADCQDYVALCGESHPPALTSNSYAADGSDRFARACTLQFPFTSHASGADNGTEAPVFVTARALACKSFGDKHVSVTCRTLAYGNTPAPSQQGVEWPGRTVSLLPARSSAAEEKNTAGKEDVFQASTRQLIEALWDKLPLNDPARPLTGLIVIAGRTGSGKSVMARAFARRYLEHCVAAGGDRRPHLVTYEDPIEEQFAPSPSAAALAGFDYTPREKEVDVRNLVDATRDALRQTPALFYVGETRDEEDWNTLLRFAGTGHLTITTGHAGSLVETMAQILQAAKARTPAQRSQVVARIAALVHIRAHKGTTGKVLVPAFWCRTPRTISAFTAEGLGSMLPNYSAERGAYGCYGRAHAAEHLEYLQSIPELRRKAVEWDLRGE